MSSNGFYLVLHGEVHIACPCEVIAVGLGKGLHHQIMCTI